MADQTPHTARRAALALVLTLVAVSGCARSPDGPDEISDPFEHINRPIHDFNKQVDQAILRPTAEFYGSTLPRPIREILDNIADNIALSGDVVNDILQLEVEDATHNTSRFILNTTIGLGGIFDPATSIGFPRRETGFGETLHTWGVPEGAYIELPFLGPSTEREAVGRVADFFTNAFSYALDGPSALAAAGVGTVDIVNDRYEFRSTIDSVFYESEDSYVQARSLYLQNLRFTYSGGDAEEQVSDIYDELFEDDLFAE